MRRGSTIKRKHVTAKNLRQPKSLKLEQRLARLELQTNDLSSAVDLLTKRCTSIQAQLDHWVARLGR